MSAGRNKHARSKARKQARLRAHVRKHRRAMKLRGRRLRKAHRYQ